MFWESDGYDIRKARYLEYQKGNINQLLCKAINVTDGIQRHLDA